MDKEPLIIIYSNGSADVLRVNILDSPRWAQTLNTVAASLLGSYTEYVQSLVQAESKTQDAPAPELSQ